MQHITRARRFSYSISSLLLILFAVLFLSPFYFIIVNSFKTFSEIVKDSASLPAVMQWSNYAQAVKQVDFLLVLTNSLLITVFSILGMVLLGSMAAWKLARVTSPVGTVMFILYVAAMVIPFQSVMIPLVKVAFTLQMINSQAGLIAIYWGFGMPFTVFLYHGFVTGVPLELEESARLEGCTDYQLFAKIVFPLLKTITITIIILQTLWVWNDFLLPSLILYKKTYQTIPLGINRFFGQYKNQWDKALPILVLSMSPIIVFFLMLQKHMIRGISEGAIK